MSFATVYLLAALSALGWGANYPLAQVAMVDEPPLMAAAIRFLLASLVMVGICCWRREPLLAAARRHAGTYLMLGAMGIGAFNLVFFFALQHTTAANASLIMATSPLLTTLLAALVLGERPRRNQLLAVPLALMGVTVVVADGSWEKLKALQLASGDLLMVIAVLSWASYNVMVRRSMPAGSPLANTTLMMIAGTVLLLIAAWVSGQHPVVPGAPAAAALLLMAVGGTVLAYLFWTIAIGRLGAGGAALFLNLVPVFAMLVDAMLGVRPGVAQLAGGALVIGAVMVSALPRRRPTL